MESNSSWNIDPKAAGVAVVGLGRVRSFSLHDPIASGGGGKERSLSRSGQAETQVISHVHRRPSRSE